MISPRFDSAVWSRVTSARSEVVVAVVVCVTLGFAIGAVIGCVAGIVICGLLQMAGTDGKTNDESTDYDTL